MGVLAGARAFPASTVHDLDGAAVALDGVWRGRGALVAVGHSDCETSKLALRYVDRLYRRRRSERAVVAVLQDGPEEARALVSELGLDVPVLLDGEPHPLGRALNLTTVPALFLVDGQGMVEEATEAFRRSDFERFARLLGAPAPFFSRDDHAPPLRPG